MSSGDEALDGDQEVASGALIEMIEPVRGKLLLSSVLAGFSVLCSLAAMASVAEIGRVLIDGGSEGRLWFWAVVAAAAAVARLVLYSSALRVSHRADAEFRRVIRSRITTHLGRIPLGWFTVHGSGPVKQAVSDDVGRMHLLVAHLPPDLVPAVLTPLVGCVYLFVVDWQFGLLFLGYVVLAVMVTAPAMRRGFAENADGWTRAMTDVTQATIEFGDGIEVQKVYGSTNEASKRLVASIENAIAVCGRWLASTGRPMVALTVLVSPPVMTAVICAIGAALIAAGWAGPADLVAFLVVGVGLPASVVHIGGMMSLIRQGQVGATHIQQLLSVEPLEEPTAPRASNGHQLEFDAVTFGYDEDRPVLEDVSLTLEPGTVTALVGPSGSGKTTLARLAARFWDVDAGTVRVGGVDVREQRLEHLMGSMAIVFQEVVLLNDSVAENVRLGRAATHDQIVDAARRAEIHDVIAALPNGYETVVGSGETHLSIGERQRVMVARALLGDAPILLLDEATAHADADSEIEVQRAIGRLVAAGATTMIIAHRIETVEHADQIVVLDRGRVVENGTHVDLMAADGLYARLRRAGSAKTSEGRNRA